MRASTCVSIIRLYALRLTGVNVLLLRVTDVHGPLIPPTDSIVYVKRQEKSGGDMEDGIALTKGDAVGPSRMASSSSVNGSRGTRYVLSGTSSRIMTGNPIAAVT